jgi:acyl carrier protein
VDDLIKDIKELIVDTLKPEDLTPEQIEDDQIIFGEGLGFDSIDALELGVALSKKYNIVLKQDSESLHEHFATPRAIAEFVITTRDS